MYAELLQTLQLEIMMTEIVVLDLLVSAYFYIWMTPSQTGGPLPSWQPLFLALRVLLPLYTFICPPLPLSAGRHILPRLHSTPPEPFTCDDDVAKIAPSQGSTSLSSSWPRDGTLPSIHDYQKSHVARVHGITLREPRYVDSR